MAGTSWHKNGKIYNLGHAAVKDLFFDDVIVEEKVDGSYGQFGMIDVGDGQGPRLRFRSNGSELVVDAPEKMFKQAVETAKELAPHLTPGWTYKGEVLAKPKHNVLAYDRAPAKGIIIFDINRGEEDFLTYEEKAVEAARLGLEVVPLLHRGKVGTADELRQFLDRVSILGGQKVEGVVIKNYKRFGIDGKALMGKFVSEAFKEVHGNDWKERNPGSGDVLERLGEKYRTPARWQKALQHLAEAGKIEWSPKDIGALMQEVPKDVEAEEKAAILEYLWDWAWPHVQRKIKAGIPEWYKDILLKRQFEDKPVETETAAQ